MALAELTHKVQTDVEEQAQTLKENPPTTLIPDKPSPPVCPNCAGAGWFRLDVPVGDPQFGKPIRCEHPIHDPERLSHLKKISHLGERELKVTLSDISKNDDNHEMLTAAKWMTADPWGWLYIWGGPGNAKTEVLIAIVNELNRRGQGPAMYTSLSTILDWMRQAYGPLAKDDYLARFDKLRQIKVLAIDEMDKPRSTEWAEEFRFNFLDDRYRSALNGETITLFAGNTNPASFGDVLFDRIRDGRFKIVFNGQSSARPHMQR